MPDLFDRLDALVDQSGMLDLGWAEAGSIKTQLAATDAWKADQLRIAMRRAEEAMSEALRNLPQDSELPGMSGMELGTLLPTAAGMGLLAASIAAIPTVASFATVTSSSLAIFTITTVSWPLVAVGTAGLATAAVLGSTLLTKAETSWRASIKKRQRSWAYCQILGLGAPRGARCFLSDVQAAVLVVGQNRMENIQ